MVLEVSVLIANPAYQSWKHKALHRFRFALQKFFNMKQGWNCHWEVR